jgi:molybdopterin molybdotransferase
MLDVRDAWELLHTWVPQLGTESVPLGRGLGRVLRGSVAVDRDQPPFDRAAMDGFAVRSAEVAAASRATPVRLRVAGESTPGAPFTGALPAAASVRIMTGAAVPEGCDAVVAVEETSGFESESVDVYAAATVGQHFTPRGRERQSGEVLFESGHRLGAADIGALAMVGAATLTVGRAPRVAILSTGNELVPCDQVPAPAAIRDSNGPMLAALAAPFAAEIVRLEPARDDPEELAQRIQLGLTFDALLLTGGVSMGAYDFVSRTLAANGVRLHFTRVALQPGKPAVFGTHPGGIVLGLPGNPVSVLTTFRLFAARCLRLQAGERVASPPWHLAMARFAWERTHPKWLLLPGRRVAVSEAGAAAIAAVDRVPYAGSGDLLAYARADCQIVLPPEIERLTPGDPVPVWPL